MTSTAPVTGHNGVAIATYDYDGEGYRSYEIHQRERVGQSTEKINGMDQIEYSPSYKKVATKGGALLNTNYALELLKSYFTSLKHPNKPYFHFI